MGGGASTQQTSACIHLIDEALCCTDRIGTLLDSLGDVGDARCLTGHPPPHDTAAPLLRQCEAASTFGLLRFDHQPSPQCPAYCIAVSQDLERSYYALQAQQCYHPADDITRLDKLQEFEAEAAAALTPAVEHIMSELHLPPEERTFLALGGTLPPSRDAFLQSLSHGGVWGGCRGSGGGGAVGDTPAALRVFQHRADPQAGVEAGDGGVCRGGRAAPLTALPAPETSMRCGVPLQVAPLSAEEKQMAGCTSAALLMLTRSEEREQESPSGSYVPVVEDILAGCGAAGEGWPNGPLCNKVLRVTLLFDEARAEEAEAGHVAGHALLANQVSFGGLASPGQPVQFVAVPFSLLLHCGGVTVQVETVFDLLLPEPQRVGSPRLGLVYALDNATQRPACNGGLVPILMNQTLEKLNVPSTPLPEGVFYGPPEMEVKEVDDGRLYVFGVWNMFLGTHGRVHPQLLASLDHRAEAGLASAPQHLLQVVVPRIATMLLEEPLSQELANEHCLLPPGSPRSASPPPDFTPPPEPEPEPDCLSAVFDVDTQMRQRGISLSAGAAEGVVAMCHAYGLCDSDISSLLEFVWEARNRLHAKERSSGAAGTDRHPSYYSSGEGARLVEAFLEEAVAQRVSPQAAQRQKPRVSFDGGALHQQEARARLLCLHFILAAVLSAKRLARCLSRQLRDEVLACRDNGDRIRRAQAAQPYPVCESDANARAAERSLENRDNYLMSCVGMHDTWGGCIAKAQSFAKDAVGFRDRHAHIMLQYSQPQGANVMSAVLLLDPSKVSGRQYIGPPSPPEDLDLRESLSLEDVLLHDTVKSPTRDELKKSGATPQFVCDAEWGYYFPSAPSVVPQCAKALFFQYFLHITRVMSHGLAVVRPDIGAVVMQRASARAPLVTVPVSVDSKQLMFLSEVYTRYLRLLGIQQLQCGEGAWVPGDPTCIPFYFSDLCALKLRSVCCASDDLDDFHSQSMGLDMPRTTSVSVPGTPTSPALPAAAPAPSVEGVLSDFMSMCEKSANMGVFVPHTRLLLCRFLSFKTAPPFACVPNTANARECAGMLRSLVALRGTAPQGLCISEPCQALPGNIVESLTLAGLFSAHRGHSVAEKQVSQVLGDVEANQLVSAAALLQQWKAHLAAAGATAGGSGSADEKVTKSVHLLHECIRSLCGNYGPMSLRLVAPLTRLASLYEEHGQADDAEGIRAYVLGVRLKHFDPLSLEVSTAINNLAVNLYEQQRFCDAEPLFVYDLALSAKILGEEHEWVATSLNNLAALYTSRGEYDKSIPLCQRDLAITTRKLGTRNLNRATSLNNLAAVYAAKGDREMALQCFTESLDIREAVLGCEHILVAEAYNNIGSLLRQMDDLPRAIMHCRKAVEVMESLPRDTLRLVAAIGTLQTLLEQTGNVDEAEALGEKLLDLKRQATSLHTAIVSSSRFGSGNFS